MSDEQAVVKEEVGLDDGDSGGEVSGETKWYDDQGYSDEEIGKIQNKGWDTIKDATGSYFELEKFRGASEEEILRIPKSEDVDGIKAMHHRLGMPETAEEYVFNEKDGETYSEDDVKWLKEAAHKRGLSSADATSLFDDMTTRAIEVNKARDDSIIEKRESDIAELKSEWGSKYDERLELGNRVLRQSGVSPEQLDSMRDTIGFQDVIKIMANIGDRIGGDQILAGDGETTSDFGKTAQQFIADKRALMEDIKADENRLTLHNQGKGPDYARMELLRKTINDLTSED